MSSSLYAGIVIVTNGYFFIVFSSRSFSVPSMSRSMMTIVKKSMSAYAGKSMNVIVSTIVSGCEECYLNLL